MRTKRSFKPLRLLIGLAMMAGGVGLIYWQLVVHTGAIRLMALAAAVVLGIVAGAMFVLYSFAKVCAECGDEIIATQLAFPPELLSAVQDYAATSGSAGALLPAPQMKPQDRVRAILALDGCNTCRSFTAVQSSLATWNPGGYFEHKQISGWRKTSEAERPILESLLQSRTSS